MQSFRQVAEKAINHQVREGGHSEREENILDLSELMDWASAL
jgi:hypothetical protein